MATYDESEVYALINRAIIWNTDNRKTPLVDWWDENKKPESPTPLSVEEAAGKYAHKNCRSCNSNAYIPCICSNLEKAYIAGAAHREKQGQKTKTWINASEGMPVKPENWPYKYSDEDEPGIIFTNRRHSCAEVYYFSLGYAPNPTVDGNEWLLEDWYWLDESGLESQGNMEILLNAIKEIASGGLLPKLIAQKALQSFYSGNQEPEFLETPCSCPCHTTAGMIHCFPCCDNGVIKTPNPKFNSGNQTEKGSGKSNNDDDDFAIDLANTCTK